MQLNFLQKISSLQIQKYNGKSVKIHDFAQFLFNEAGLVVIFKTGAIKASDERKIRASLKRNGIFMKRFKKKNLLFFFNFLQASNIFNFDFNMMDSISLGYQGACVLLAFSDIDHFFFL